MIQTIWFLLIGVWLLTGIVGLAYAFASLRAALRLRRLPESEERITDLTLYLAIARTLIFFGPFLGVPILYNMFHLRSGTQLGDIVPVVLPFGVILLGALMLVAGAIVTLILTVMDVRTMMRRDGG